MKLSKVIFIIFLMLFFSTIAYTQNGMQLLYENSIYRISKFEGKTYRNSNQKNLFLQIGYLNTNSQNESYSYLKYNRNNHSWYVPSNGFLNPSWYYHKKWNSWIVNEVNSFAQDDYDTNSILKYSRMFVIDLIFDEIIFTNDGGLISSPAYHSSNDVFTGFDIDSSSKWAETSYYLGIPNIFQGFIKKIVNWGGGSFSEEDLDTIPGLKYIFQGGFLKVNPFRKNYIYTAADNMMLSTSSGYNFFSINIPIVKELIFYDENKLYGYTSSKFYTSNNSGLNWDSTYTIAAFNILQTDPDNSNRLYGGSDSGLYLSTNGGIEWNLYNNSFTPSKRVIGISKDKNSGDTVFVSTDYKVYKIWQPNITSINYQFQTVKKFELYQNFPNPFNPVTKINFNIPQDARGETQDARLVVFDIVGKEIITLVNQKLSAGSYSVEFDGTNFPSGIYYYKLVVSGANALEAGSPGKAGDFSEVRKMILIK